jgi:hypothetical protein
MLPDRAVREKLVAFGDNLRERGKVEGIQEPETGREFPGDEETDDTDDAEPIGENKLGAPKQLAPLCWLVTSKRNELE